MNSLALVDGPDHVCCRYRIRAFEPALLRAGWSISYQTIERGAFGRWLQLARLPRLDTVILQRKLLPDWHLRVLRSRAARLVFDFDDAVLYRDSYDPRGPDCPRRAARFAATVRAADVITAGNDFLADCALRAGAKADRVRVIPTCVDTGRYRVRRGDSTRSPGLELVWIGSSSTLQGLEQVRSLWDAIARAVPGVRMKLICDRTTDFGAMPVEAVEWSQSGEAAALAGSDAGITWIPDDLWSRGKCGLKAIQYMAAGLPVLASPVGVHEEMIRPRENGFLLRTESEWISAVRNLSVDPQTCRHMGRMARQVVEAGYSVASWEGAVVAAWTGAAVVPPPAFVKTAENLAGGPSRPESRTGFMAPLSITRAGNTQDTGNRGEA